LKEMEDEMHASADEDSLAMLEEQEPAAAAVAAKPPQRRRPDLKKPWACPRPGCGMSGTMASKPPHEAMHVRRDREAAEAAEAAELNPCDVQVIAQGRGRDQSKLMTFTVIPSPITKMFSVTELVGQVVQEKNRNPGGIYSTHNPGTFYMKHKNLLEALSTDEKLTSLLRSCSPHPLQLYVEAVPQTNAAPARAAALKGARGTGGPKPPVTELDCKPLTSAVSAAAARSANVAAGQVCDVVSLCV
jgi:hypothetical protein